MSRLSHEGTPLHSTVHRTMQRDSTVTYAPSVSTSNCMYSPSRKCIWAIVPGLPSLQLVLAIVITILSFYIDSIVQIFAQKRSVEYYHGEPHALPDLGFDAFPFIPDLWDRNVGDMYVTLIVCLTVLRFYLTPILRQTIFRRWLLVVSVLLLLRGCSIIITLLPDPYPTCKAPDLDNFWVDSILILLQIRRTCGDVLYSGHTVNITLAALVWTEYSHLSPIILCAPTPSDCVHCTYCHNQVAPQTDIEAVIPPYIPTGIYPPYVPLPVHILSPDGSVRRCTITKYLAWLAAITGYFLIIASHYHYSVDVFVGFFFTCLFWKAYHLTVRVCHLRRDWLGVFLCWFEANSEDIAIFHLCIPSPYNRQSIATQFGTDSTTRHQSQQDQPPVVIEQLHPGSCA